MRFALVADVHIGKYQTHKRIFRKNTRYSRRLLKQFVRKVNRSHQTEFVVQLGDLVEDIDKRRDMKNYSRGVRILSKLHSPIMHVVGNHDLRNLSHSFLRQQIGHERLYYLRDFAEYRCIVLLTDQHFLSDGTIDTPQLGAEQLAWLAAAVKTDKKILLFSHAALVPCSTEGNFWFDGVAEQAYIEDWKQFEAVIKGANIVALFNGHLHWSKLQDYHGIPHVTIQSLVENDSGRVKGAPTRSYAVVDVGINRLRIHIYGKNGGIVEVPIKQ